MRHDPSIRLGYADGPFGQIHYARAGRGPALLCLHQTPRSWDEFADLMPLLAPQLDVIAMDTPGMGASALGSIDASIEAYATAAAALLDALAIERAHVMGHHTGGVIAIELAARHPQRVDRLVLSSTPYIDAEARARRANRSPIDSVEMAPDGSHLTEWWRRRQSFYPVDRPDILQRFVHDAIAAREVEEGHHAVGRYQMEETIGLVRAPTLCIGASADPYAFPELEPLSRRISDAITTVIEGGTVGLIEHKHAEVVAAVLTFLMENA